MGRKSRTKKIRRAQQARKAKDSHHFIAGKYYRVVDRLGALLPGVYRCEGISAEIVSFSYGIVTFGVGCSELVDPTEMDPRSQGIYGFRGLSDVGFYELLSMRLEIAGQRHSEFDQEHLHS